MGSTIYSVQHERCGSESLSRTSGWLSFLLFSYYARLGQTVSEDGQLKNTVVPNPGTKIPRKVEQAKHQLAGLKMYGSGESSTKLHAYY